MSDIHVTGYDQTDRLGRIAERIQRWVVDDQIDGAALAVAAGGEQVAEFHIGEAAPGYPADERTLWPLASIAKLYTAAAIMVLVDRGDLTLNYPVRQILPEFDGGGREKVTLRHLLTHTSGLIYESPVMEQRLIDQTPIDNLIDEAYLYPLMFTPGTRFSYSDYGYAIAGRIASRVAGQSFPELVQQLVLEPAGLRDTYMTPPESAHSRLAHVVNSLAYGTDGAMYNSPYALGLGHPAFAAVASVRDLLQFILLFRRDGSRAIHSRAALRTMTTDQTGGHAPGGVPGVFDSPAPVPWGIGFMLATPGGGRPDLLAPGSYGHGGASGCTVWLDPVADVAIAYVSNRHARSGRPPFTHRQGATVNGILSALG